MNDNSETFFANRSIVVTDAGVENLDDTDPNTRGKVFLIGEIDKAQAQWTPPWQWPAFFSAITIAALYFQFWIAAAIFALIAGLIWKYSWNGQVEVWSESRNDIFFSRMSYLDAQKAEAAISKARENLGGQN